MYKEISKKDKKTIQVGVALSGGGALGSAHVGALQALVDHHIPIHAISGTSAGAIVAACYAFEIPFEKVIEIAKKLSWYKVSRLTIPRRGLVSHRPLRSLFHETFGEVNIEDAHIPLAIVATDLESAERVVFRKGPLAEALLASTSLPGFFTPVEIDEKMLVDGGVADNFPISALDDMGAEIKIGVNVNRWISQKKPRSVFDVISKSLSIMNAYRHPQKENEVFIEPHLEDFSISDFKHADKLAAQGYRAATLKIGDIRALMASRHPSIWTRFVRWISV